MRQAAAASRERITVSTLSRSFSSAKWPPGRTCWLKPPVVCSDHRRIRAGRDEEGLRLALPASPQRAGQLEGHQRPHAVPEKRKAPAELARQRRGQRVDQRIEPLERTLLPAGLPAGQLDRAHLDVVAD